MASDRFSPIKQSWTPRPSDPSDAFFAQLVRAEPSEGGVGLFGVPFDGAVIGRPGARGGPDAIRAQMARLKPWTKRSGALTRPVHDWGNVRLQYGTVDTVHKAVQAAAGEVVAAGEFPVCLGGDHSLTFPLVKAHAKRHDKIGVINLDAHLDVRDVINGALNSGQSFGRLLESGIVPGKNLVEVGIRDFANSPAYADKVTKAGGHIITANQWRDEGLAVVEHAIDLARDGVDAVYLSVDMDVLDHAFGPGVSAPTPGGIDTNELFGAIRLIAERAHLIGADFMEVAPSLDRDNRTSRAAAYGVLHLLAGLAGG